jgi:hypothetical protein
MIVTGGCPQCGTNQDDRSALQIFSDSSHANVIETCDYQQNPCMQNTSGFFVTNDGSGEFAKELFVIGHLYADNGCTGCAVTETRTVSGAAVTSFVPREPVPTIETFGQGQLVRGQARIPVDAAFASTMNKAQPYLVFLTPRGDSRGLYVTQEEAAGFVVRENGAGTSSIGFDYRIVAKPLDAGRPAPAMRYTRGAAPRQR